MRVIFKLVLCVTTFLLGACASVKIASDGERHQYFGFVEVVVPKKKATVTQAYKITSMGIAIVDGVTIGLRDEEQVLVPFSQGELSEAPCGVIVIVRSNKEAEHATNILRPLEGKNICITSFE